jgi:tetratricopeptide (TPR) repeat protein
MALTLNLCSDAKEDGMKRLGLIIALFLLFAAVSDGAAPDNKEFRKGLKYYNSRNYKAAVKQFKEYVNNKPDPAAYYLIGYSLYKLGKFSEADEYFSQAYFIDPEFSLEKAGLIKKTSEERLQRD